MAASTEEIIDLPAEYGEHPMGFSIDGGGSVLKLIYKSKGGEKGNNGKVRLYYRHFPMTHYEELLKFIQENCDTNGDENFTAVHTGVRIQHFEDRLVSLFHSPVNVTSEFEAAVTGITTLCEHCPDDAVFHRTSPAAMAHCLSNLQQFAPMLQSMADGDGTMTEKTTDEAAAMQVEVMAGVMTMLANPDPDALATIYTADCSVFPCFYVICGSAFTSMVCHEDKSTEMGELIPVGGRALLGLGRTLCGAESYDELVEMAIEGDSNKVDILSGELKAAGSKDDMYGAMPEHIPVFTFGKLHEAKYDGTYTKKDIAASLVKSFAYEIAHSAVLNARLRKLKSVVMTGAFLRHEYVREQVEKFFIEQTIWIPGDLKPVIRIAKNPGHIIVTGSYVIGLEKRKKCATSDENDQ